MRSLSSSGTLNVALAILLAFGIGDSFAVAAVYWADSPAFDSPTSGVWTALAFDAARGVLYRPIVSELGYGGTRYMPLSFLGHATLIQLGIDPIWSGVIWMQATVLAMCGAMIVLAKQQGLSITKATALSAVTFCTTIYQQYVTDVNAEYLAVTLGLLALVVFNARGPLILVALLGALSVFAKFTSLYVPGALLVYLVVKRQFREAIAFVITGVSILAILFFGTQWISEGEFLNALSATASGGTDWAFASGLLRRFFQEIFVSNPAIGVCFVVAVLVWLASPNRGDVIAISFLFCFVITVLTYASKGIAGNHVIPLNALSLLVMARGFTRLRPVLIGGFAILTSIIAATWLPNVPSPRKTLVERENLPVESVVNRLKETRVGNGPIFSIHPAYPILLGESAFLLDGFNMRWFLETGHPASTDLANRVANRDFSLVVIEWQEDFQGLFKEHYRAVDKMGRFQVMVPKS